MWEIIGIFTAMGFASFYVLWMLYLAVMNLKGARDEGTLIKPVYYLGIPILYAGYLLDIAFNWVYGTVLFIQVPREAVLTSRLKKNIHNEGWRGDLARWMCVNLLSPFDPDPRGHCKEKEI